MLGILGKKLGMSRVLNEKGLFVPVTYVQSMPNEIIQVKTIDKDGYSAVVLGFDAYNKPSKNKKFKHVREVRVADDHSFKKGQTLSLADLGEFSEADISSISKGKGFQGPVRRWNFRVARKTHGTKYIRHGSTMSSAITGRSKPGIKMAGRMGGDKHTLRARKILNIDTKNHIYAVKGPVPGAADALVLLRLTK